ncbi:MAG TPA: amidohydrolase family protein [Terriglobia bacterium]|nr:amidohydrolase family protein [Terriglobia bacterium]
MIFRSRLFFIFPTLLASLGTLAAQTAPPRLIDAHVHHNGDPAFLEKLVARLDSVDGLALLLTAPKDLDSVKTFIAKHPNRIMGMGDISLDDPRALELVDRFHAAGFRGLGELSGPLKNYDDRSYWPIYERAEKYGMIILFHTGIVNRMEPDIPSDISVDRMRPTTLDGIARRFPKLTLIGAHLGNPDYAWAAEVTRWNPNLYFDLSGSSLIKKQDDPTFWKSIFWWSGVVSPHTPANAPNAFERLVFGSDVFNGELEEFDRQVERYHKMLDACGVPKASQDMIFAGTMWKILSAQK